jgi:hypothetical protein
MRPNLGLRRSVLRALLDRLHNARRLDGRAPVLQALVRDAERLAHSCHEVELFGTAADHVHFFLGLVERHGQRLNDEFPTSGVAALRAPFVVIEVSSDRGYTL